MMFGLSTDQLIAVCSSVAAAVSATATLFTVMQVSENRKSSYRPEIIFVEKRFSSAGEIKHGDPQKNISVEMYNIGLGSAKNIEICWSFAIASAVNKINLLASLGAEVNKHRIENNCIYSEGEHAPATVYFWSKQTVRILDFALPASIDRQPLIIAVPHAYSTLWELYVHSALRINKTEMLTVFPMLSCTITYQDVGGVKYKFKREFVFNIESFFIGQGINGSVSTRVN